MKGIIFNEFLNMVEEEFGYETVDTIINQSNLPNNGAYTSVGTYPHTEIVTLIANLSKVKSIPIPLLLESFGIYAFAVFAKAYHEMIAGYENSLSFLANVEDTIHVEVVKLYPEAELPTLMTVEQSNDKMIMIYKSSRAMSDMAKGLIKGCLKHFNEKANIEDIPLKEDKTEVQFTLTMEL